MHLIRESRIEDVDMFFKLAKTSHFVNLPPAKDIIEEKIQRSRESFEALGGKSARSVKRTKDAFTG
ncbi:MAG: arginine N-succinyltransferase, partial [Planctomycetota bacterium]